MRILLQDMGIAPEQGGGHTITQDIFGALLRISDRCAHEFFIIDSASAHSKNLELPSNFSRIRIVRSFSRRLVERSIYEVKRHIARGERGAGEGLIGPGYDAIRKALIRNRVDCSLSLTPSSWSPVLPNILTVWDLEHRRKAYFPELTANGEWEKREEMYRTILPKAVAVITGTQVGKTQIERFYGVDPSAVKVIPFPTPSFALEVAKASGSSRDELPGGISGEYLFYPAQYWPHKNHVRLLQAVKILREQHDWDGILVCCGSDQGNLKYIQRCATELGIQHQVQFVGFVKQHEVAAIYRHALALTFVSYFGPDNLPPLEAFALGCPVIASAVEGAKEQLGDAVLYVNPDNASEIASAVWRIKNESGQRESLIAAGRLRALHSTAESYAGQLIHLLDSLEVRFECFR